RGLRIEHPRHESRPQDPQPGQPAIDTGTKYAVQHLVETLAFPLPVHVSLADSPAAGREHAAIDVGIVDTDIPGAVAVEGDVGAAQQRFDGSTIARRHGVRSDE